MQQNLFQQLTLHELEKYSSELELAIEAHARWIAQLNRTLICKLPPNESDLSAHPDHLCKFGRWYHGIDNPVLLSLKSFVEIDAVHQQVHLAAKELLLKSERNEVVSERDYDALIETAEALRHKVGELLHELSNNQHIVSRLMSTVFENASEGVIITDPDSTIISVNRAFSDVTGYEPHEVIGKQPSILRSGYQSEDFYAHMWHEIKHFGQWQGEIWNRNSDGKDYLEWLSIAAVKDNNGTVSHYVGIFSDITSEKENEDQLLYLAHYDQLTHLPNRILFNDRLQQAIAQADRQRQQVAVMFLDLDGFKAVNDSLGHRSGDILLQQVAERLTDCLRAMDTVARFGGDEFTIVLTAIEGRDDVIRIARKITQEIAKPYDLEGTAASITTSVGISFYPTDSRLPVQLIQHADHAMYHAKRHGKNHFEFYSEV